MNEKEFVYIAFYSLCRVAASSKKGVISFDEDQTRGSVIFRNLLVVVSRSADSTAEGTGLPTLYERGWNTCGTVEPWDPGTKHSVNRNKAEAIIFGLKDFSHDILSYFGMYKIALYIEGNLKIIVFYTGKTLKR